jgi:hypothetical protein
MTSKNKMLKDDLRRKLIRFYRIRPMYILIPVLVYLAAVIVVMTNKKMFFETDHVGRLLEMQLEEDEANEENKVLSVNL